ncbi:MAG TPA: DUF4350 domain-containing protein [Blastocatellia bacterium]|nr:DUF4350 domain-containing protein [Blastocatellia bacterium]
MRKNTSAILIIAGLFLLLVILNLIFMAGPEAEAETELNGNRSSYASTPYGTRAFYTLLEEQGHGVTRLESPFTDVEKLYGLDALFIIAPPAKENPSPEEFERLREWVEAGGLLIIIDREIQVDFGGANVETSPKEFPDGARPLQPSGYTRGVERVSLSRAASGLKVTSRGEGYPTYHVGDAQSAVLADFKSGEGRVVLLADPFVVANNGIRESDNVILAANLVGGRRDRKIGFDEYHHGYGSSKSEGLMSYFAGTPIPWMMWQGALIIALLVYTQGRRFARPIPLKRERRTTNLEFVSSMANITRLARASDVAMQNIHSEFRKRLCRYAGVPSGTADSLLASAVARRSKIGAGELEGLLARCERVARGEAVSDSELFEIVKSVRDVETRLGI